MNISKLKKGLMIGDKVARIEIIWDNINFNTYLNEFKKEVDFISGYNFDGSTFPIYMNQIIDYYLQNDLEILACIFVGIAFERISLSQNGKIQEMLNLAKNSIQQIASSIVPDKDLFFEKLIRIHSEYSGSLSLACIVSISELFD